MGADITDSKNSQGVVCRNSDTLTQQDQSQTDMVPGYTTTNISTEDRCVDEDSVKGRKGYFKTAVKWKNATYYGLLHLAAVYCIFTFNYLQDWRTTLWIIVMRCLAFIGITAGVHRYWTHRTYKAKMPFQILLATCYAMAGQNPISIWVRDHRVHHKYTDTDADPHNSKRGLFFSHMGWLMMKKHPDVIKKGRQIDMSDIKSDPLLRFVDKNFIPIAVTFTFVLPTLVPMYFWNETFSRAFISQCIIRYVWVLNATWTVNSFAHAYGTKPYDKSIRPTDNMFVSYVAAGEGWHNYHHVFPWDYRAAELGGGLHNYTTTLIDVSAKLGWVYDLKQPSPTLIKAVVQRNNSGGNMKQEIPFISTMTEQNDKISSNKCE